MKPRQVTTKKLLVGLALAAASTGQAVAPAHAATARPHRDAAGYPLVGNLIRKAGGGAPSPPPDSEVPSALLELREQLLARSRKEAIAQMKAFRPLCDAQGYPLVGNVVRKGDTEIQPSTFCQEVRKTEAPKT